MVLGTDRYKLLWKRYASAQFQPGLRRCANCDPARIVLTLQDQEALSPNQTSRRPVAVQYRRHFPSASRNRGAIWSFRSSLACPTANDFTSYRKSIFNLSTMEQGGHRSPLGLITLQCGVLSPFDM